MYEATHL